MKERVARAAQEQFSAAQAQYTALELACTEKEVGGFCSVRCFFVFTLRCPRDLRWVLLCGWWVWGQYAALLELACKEKEVGGCFCVGVLNRVASSSRAGGGGGTKAKLSKRLVRHPSIVPSIHSRYTRDITRDVYIFSIHPFTLSSKQ